MKRILLLAFFMGFITICKGQQFSFVLKFVDAVGNTDSLTLGYDLCKYRVKTAQLCRVKTAQL